MLDSIITFKPLSGVFIEKAGNQLKVSSFGLLSTFLVKFTDSFIARSGRY